MSTEDRDKEFTSGRASCRYTIPSPSFCPTLTLHGCCSKRVDQLPRNLESSSDRLRLHPVPSHRISSLVQRTQQGPPARLFLACTSWTCDRRLTTCISAFPFRTFLRPRRFRAREALLFDNPHRTPPASHITLPIPLCPPAVVARQI